jgi:hypothetical protein
MKRFAIIGAARSGTTVTHSLLCGHPEVSLFGEEIRIREMFGQGSSLFTFQPLRKVAQQKRVTAGLFDVFALSNSSPETRAAGIKCAFGSLEASRLFVNGVKEHFPDMHIILVRRDDLVAQFGSAVRARKTGLYHSWRGSAKPMTDAMRLSKGLFRHYVLETRASLDLIQSLESTHPMLEVSYERDICSGLQYHQKVYRFLGITEMEPVWVQNRKVSPPPEEYISNYAELRRLQEDALRCGSARFSIERSLRNAIKRVLHQTADWARRYP